MYRKIVTPPREEEGGLTLAAQNAVNAIANDLGAGPAYYSPIPAINPAFVQPDGNSYPTVFGRYNHQLQAADPQKFGNHRAKGVNGTSNGHRPPPPSGPFAIFTPCSNSHPFEERTVQVSRGEDHAIKIGRAVARFQPAPNNAIFECKVLSRNHAIIWYEDDKFFIKDTRSSNGTFVNNYRLSNNAEESQPKLLRSGDILQLGVEIVDNSKNVASGCITCILRLVDERGEECLGPPEENPLSARMPHAFGESVPHNCSLISNEKLFVMSQYMKEAMHREKMLTEKLRSLESLLEMTRESAERGWKALINEERLLARIEILESQLTCAKAAAGGNADEMLERVNAMLEDQGKAEEELRVKLIEHQEKIYDAETTAENFKQELEGQKKENQWLQSRNDELVAQLEHARDEYQMLLEERKENENGAGKAAANGAFSVSRVEDSPVTKPALEQSTANEDGLKADEEPNSANLDHSVELEVNPFADELSDSKADAAEEHAHPSPPHAVQPEAPPPVFFQEAEVQTDPVEQPAPVETTPTVDEQPTRVEQPNVDVLFTSVFPLAMFLGVFLERLFRWLPDRPPAALEQPEAEDPDRLKKES